MTRKFVIFLNAHALLCFFSFVALIIFALHISSVYEHSLWKHTNGKITYVKAISDDNFMYTIEYMAQTDSVKNKVRLFKHDPFPPFRGQKVRLKYRKNNAQDFVLLGELKYMPALDQDKS